MREVNLSAIDLNLLVVFEAILAEQSVSGAARRVHLTQSAVSHALGRLRHLVGDPLFLRTPQGMVPTAHAQAIAPRIRNALGEIQQALYPEDSFDPAQSTDRFRIGMTDYMAYILMPELAARLERSAPGIVVTVIPLHARACVGRIEDGEIDLFVGNPPVDPPQHLASLAIFGEDHVCVARAGHPAFPLPLSRKAFLARRHLNVAPSGEPGYVDRELGLHGVSRDIAMTVGSFLLVPALLDRSDLIAVLPARLALRLAAPYALQLSPLPFALRQSPIALTWHRRFDKDPGLLWLCREIVDLCGDGVSP
ncbi:LysR family transcriptional regulator [Flavisphingomonas formosensis]|uniref:LysR family transcriptional regulator n=1 Tax=Flavisphingomonas formosensis TaxID=861534 RepID=UPI0018DF6405|nr:LysR family transcriptional regulator [Sphingomonas formosensis]